LKLAWRRLEDWCSLLLRYVGAAKLPVHIEMAEGGVGLNWTKGIPVEK